MMRELLNVAFGVLMVWCALHQPKYRKSFAVLASAFLGLAGVAARGGVIPKVFSNPALDAFGRAIVVGK